MMTEKVLALLLVALAGCGSTDLYLYSCQEPDRGHKDANGEPDPCHYNDPDAGDAGDAGDADDAGDAEPPDAAGETCAGPCVPGLVGEWHGPALLWMGDEAAAPPCPTNAGHEVYTGHADRVAPITCGACACAPPAGSCHLPATLTTSSTLCSANDVGAFHAFFDPPANWSGTCTPANPVPGGILCGGVPCVQSITIAPLTVEQTECQPITPPNVQTPPIWKTFARACTDSNVVKNCGPDVGVCAPPASGSKFRTCIHDKGDTTTTCPATYPHRSVFYNDFVDDRTCSPCTCGAPSTGACTGSISVFKDDKCGASLVVSGLIDATGAKCHDIPPGTALGSKSASEPTFAPGVCKADGGTPTIKDIPHLGTVFCCLESQ